MALSFFDYKKDFSLDPLSPLINYRDAQKNLYIAYIIFPNNSTEDKEKSKEFAVRLKSFSVPSLSKTFIDVPYQNRKVPVEVPFDPVKEHSITLELNVDENLFFYKRFARDIVESKNNTSNPKDEFVYNNSSTKKNYSIVIVDGNTEKELFSSSECRLSKVENLAYSNEAGPLELKITFRFNNYHFSVEKE